MSVEGRSGLWGCSCTSVTPSVLSQRRKASKICWLVCSFAYVASKFIILSVLHPSRSALLKSRTWLIEQPFKHELWTPVPLAQENFRPSFVASLNLPAFIWPQKHTSVAPKGPTRQAIPTATIFPWHLGTPFHSASLEKLVFLNLPDKNTPTSLLKAAFNWDVGKTQQPYES